METNEEHQILPEMEVNETWERNHLEIVGCMEGMMQQNQPLTKTRIAEETGLSRTTVYAHFKEFEEKKFLYSSEKLLAMMRARVLQNVCKKAIDGDTHSAKVFLDATGKGNIGRQVINNRTNIIQFNGLVLNEQKLQSLTNQEQIELECFLKALGKPKEDTNKLQKLG